MKTGIVCLRSSAPVNAGPELAAYERRKETAFWGFQFERPSNRGVVRRRATAAERAATDTNVDVRREEIGENVALREMRRRQFVENVLKPAREKAMEIFKRRTAGDGGERHGR